MCVCVWCTSKRSRLCVKCVYFASDFFHIRVSGCSFCVIVVYFQKRMKVVVYRHRLYADVS